MIKQILAIIMAGITVIGETYILKFENLRYLHGIHYFIDLLIMIALPTITILLFFLAFRPGREQEPERKSEEKPVENSAAKHKRKLQGLIGDNLPLKSYLESVTEQIDRFEQKIEKARKLCKEVDPVHEATLDAARTLFYARVKELEDICDAFDSKEYKNFTQGLIRVDNPALREKKLRFFRELQDAAAKIVNDNEDLIIKIDEVIKAIYDAKNDTSWNVHSLIAVEELESFVEDSRASVERNKDVNRQVAEEWKRDFMSAKY